MLPRSARGEVLKLPTVRDPKRHSNSVMPALGAGIHAFSEVCKGVDARTKSAHDGNGLHPAVGLGRPLLSSEI